METDKLKGLLERLARWKIPLLILLLGLMLMLLPSGGGQKSAEPSEGERLEAVLSLAQGVGRSRVLLSEHGAVVVCEGAENAAVRLEILRALASSTGFGADRVTILKMAE